MGEVTYTHTKFTRLQVFGYFVCLFGIRCRLRDVMWDIPHHVFFSSSQSLGWELPRMLHLLRGKLCQTNNPSPKLKNVLLILFCWHKLAAALPVSAITSLFAMQLTTVLFRCNFTLTCKCHIKYSKDC